MFGSSRNEEETFDFGPKVEKKVQAIPVSDQPDMEEVMEKINTITQQINLISKYLSYLSQKFDKTIDDAMTYDKTLDDIEGRINSLKNKIERLEIVSPDVDLAEDRERAI
jgi:chromosome segregation ATPase